MTTSTTPAVAAPSAEPTATVSTREGQARQRRHLVIRLPENEVERYLRLIHACGVLLDTKDGEQHVVMPSSTPGQSILMAWAWSTERLFDRALMLSARL